jgi:hypothetical protein
MARRPNFAGAACVAAMLALASGSLAADGWSTYRNAEFRFSVDTPSPPEIKVNNVAAGDLPGLTGTVAVAGGGGLFFEVGDFRAAIKAGQVDEAHLLDHMMSRDLSALKLTEDEGAVISVGGAPGREYTAHNAELVMKKRILMKGGRVYAAYALGLAAVGAPAEYARFARSLKPD